jgi:SH3-like domain-containing protein
MVMTERTARTSGRLSLLFAVLVAVLAAPAGGWSAEQQLKLPRFASLRSGEINVRTGPNVRYPVDWVFVRRNMPVEIVAEFDTWRKIRDFQGTEGWVHTSMLSGRRTMLITGEVRTLRRSDSAEAPAVARLEPGVIGQLQQCRGDWCRLEAGGLKGWLRRSEFWGAYPDEAVK